MLFHRDYVQTILPTFVNSWLVVDSVCHPGLFLSLVYSYLKDIFHIQCSSILVLCILASMYEHVRACMSMFGESRLQVSKCVLSLSVLLSLVSLVSSMLSTILSKCKGAGGGGGSLSSESNSSVQNYLQ